MISLEGMTVILSIYDHDILWKDDFIGEAFVSVTTARRLEENQTVDQCPAIMLTLRRPKEQEGPFKVILEHCCKLACKLVALSILG